MKLILDSNDIKKMIIERYNTNDIKIDDNIVIEVNIDSLNMLQRIPNKIITSSQQQQQQSQSNSETDEEIRRKRNEELVLKRGLMVSGGTERTIIKM